MNLDQAREAGQLADALADADRLIAALDREKAKDVEVQVFDGGGTGIANGVALPRRLAFAVAVEMRLQIAVRLTELGIDAATQPPSGARLK